MVGKKRERGSNERLDRIGGRIVRASAMNEREAEAVASSGLLYARLRAKIASERRRHEEGERWFALLDVIWRAVPAMALVAVFALALFISVSPDRRALGSFSDEALLGAHDAGIERVVFIDRQPLSSDEVLATILNADEREVVR